MRKMIYTALALAGAVFILLSTVNCYAQNLFNNTFDYVGEPEFGWSISINDDSTFSVASSGESQFFNVGVLYWRFTSQGNFELFQNYFMTGNDVYPGLSHTMKQLSHGEYFLAGGVNEYDTLDQDVVVLKVDSEGNQIFFKSIETGNFDAAYNSTLLSDNGFALTGFTYPDSLTLSNLLLMKVDSSGNYLWHKSYGSEKADIGLQVSEWTENRIITSGVKKYTLTNYAPWVLITDSAGNILKEKEWNTGALYCGGGNLKLTLDQQFYMWGCLDTVITPGNYEYPRYVAKMDTNFNFLWEIIYDKVNPHAIYIVKQVEDSSFVLVGFEDEEYNFSPLGWIAKVDKNGNKLWEHTYKYGNSTFNYFSDFQQTADKGFIITGSTNGPSSQDVWLVKLDSMGCLNPNECFTGDLTVEVNDQNDFRIAPNPAFNQTNIVYNIAQRNSKAEFVISDLTGSEIVYRAVDAYNDAETFDVSLWQQGVYFCSLFIDRQFIKSEKFVVMK